MQFTVHNVPQCTYNTQCSSLYTVCHSVCIYTVQFTVHNVPQCMYIHSAVHCTQCATVYVYTQCSSLYTMYHSVCIIHSAVHCTQCATVYVYTQCSSLYTMCHSVYTQCSSLYTMCHSVCIYTVQFTVHSVPQCMYIHSVGHCTQCATVYV